MLLQSVRDLKLQLVAEVLAPSMLAHGQAPNRGRNSGAISLAAASEDAPGRLAAASVALGIAQSGNEFHLAIRIQHENMRNLPMVQSMVAKAKGEVDLRVTGLISKRAATSGAPAPQPAGQPWHRIDQATMLIGCSVGHHQVSVGSIGAFVKDGHGSYILSNNHVLANENNCAQGDIVLQRARSDGGKVGSQNRAILQRWISLTLGTNNNVDAAIAACDENIIDPTLLRGIYNGFDRKLTGITAAGLAPVYKIGRTTGASAGRISAFELVNVPVAYSMGTLFFDNVLEIRSDEGNDFSQGGDSGSLIINEEMQGVGLLFAGTTGAPPGVGVTYANPLNDVLRLLQVQLIT